MATPFGGGSFSNQIGQRSFSLALESDASEDGVGVKTDDVLRRNWLIPEKQSPYDVGASVSEASAPCGRLASKAWVVEVSATDDDQLLD